MEFFVIDTGAAFCIFPAFNLGEWRFRLVEDGHPLPQHQRVLESVKKNGNSMMKPRNERGDWANGLNVKDLTKESGQFVFHAGCNLSYSGVATNTAAIALKLLVDAGLDVGIMGASESCCGSRIYDIGYRSEFTNIAKRSIEAWSRARVNTVVTPCSHCYFAFKRLYPKLGANVKVVHVVELVDSLIKQGKIKLTKNIPLSVTYHDPCHLGRLGEPYVPWNGVEKKIFGRIKVHEPPKPRYIGANGVYEPPRDILKAIPGLKLIEMERVKESAWCCGAGGGVKEAYPDFALWTAGKRLEEAKDTGAGALVSACPWCEDNLLDAVKSGGQKTKVYDVIELVRQAI